ncbi:MAG: DUF4160 domain-containing protein [Candidatus Kerfeldbacteria bacterium]|nr:DUF4160 domain-containing protein [Candidatus Kerfeldbacteria bacterium]
MQQKIELQEFSIKLTNLYPRLRIWTDGRVYEIKELVGQKNSLKFYIYPEDHNPPHFHVISQNGDVDVSFKIEDGKFLRGKAKRKFDLKKIQYFYDQYRPELQSKWNAFQKN